MAKVGKNRKPYSYFLLHAPSLYALSRDNLLWWRKLHDESMLHIWAEGMKGNFWGNSKKRSLWAEHMVANGSVCLCDWNYLIRKVLRSAKLIRLIFHKSFYYQKYLNFQYEKLSINFTLRIHLTLFVCLHGKWLKHVMKAEVKTMMKWQNNMKKNKRFLCDLHENGESFYVKLIEFLYDKINCRTNIFS
jgi:hypothetical protein